MAKSQALMARKISPSAASPTPVRMARGTFRPPSDGGRKADANPRRLGGRNDGSEMSSGSVTRMVRGPGRSVGAPTDGAGGCAAGDRAGRDGGAGAANSSESRSAAEPTSSIVRSSHSMSEKNRSSSPGSSDDGVGPVL